MWLEDTTPVDLHITSYTPENASCNMLKEFEYEVDNSGIVQITIKEVHQPAGPNSYTITEKYLQIKALTRGTCNLTIT